MAIECDATYGQPSAEAGIQGLAVARSIALMSYRGGAAYNKTQEDRGDEADCFTKRVNSYQRYQGQKLQQRFNAYSYYRLSQTVDSHDVSRGRGGMRSALSQIKARCLIVAITSDILFPPEDHAEFIEFIPNNEFHLIDSDFGHDGFLVEHEQLNNIIQKFMAE
jgi:homoserine O-acetyltransferase